ncbi:hypothetical protein [Ideonella sp.]|uniref:hypothetical protein n=1 Tax=Ideonella sp. TaxID=1929293 RepID=UPI0035AD973B
MKVDARTAAGWALAVAAVAVGHVQWGWRGVVLALTVVVFWLLLQFSRALRAMRAAAGAPVGTVASAVMLHARLKPGMTLPQILPLTGSLGRRLAEEPDTYAWTDASGARVEVVLVHGRVTQWQLQRPEAPPAA